MARISKKDTEWQAGYLNELTGSPLTKGQWLNGKFQTNKGNYYITGAGDFYQLERVVNDWGGRVIILEGKTYRELYQQIRAFTDGVRSVLNKED